MKITQVGAELFHADGRAGRRTDRHVEAIYLKNTKFRE
jgi:hypothetical protein